MVKEQFKDCVKSSNWFTNKIKKTKTMRQVREPRVKRYIVKKSTTYDLLQFTSISMQISQKNKRSTDQ